MPSLWIPLAGCLAWVILLLSPQHSLQHLPSLSSLALCKSHLACPHRWVTYTLFCLFLIWADKCSLEEKSPNSAIRVHHVFVLSKSDLGPQGLFQIFYLLLIAPSLSPWCLGWTRPVPLPSGSQPQCCHFSLSVTHILSFTSEEELGSFFLALLCPHKLIFVFSVNIFSCVSEECGASFLPRLTLHSALGPVPGTLLQGPASSLTSFLSLGQLLPLCLRPMSKCFQLYLPTIQLLLPGQTS